MRRYLTTRPLTCYGLPSELAIVLKASLQNKKEFVDLTFFIVSLNRAKLEQLHGAHERSAAHRIQILDTHRDVQMLAIGISCQMLITRGCRGE